MNDMPDNILIWIIIGILAIIAGGKDVLLMALRKKGLINGGNGYDKDKSMKRFDELNEKINLATNDNHHAIVEKLDKILEFLVRIDERIK